MNTSFSNSSLGGIAEIGNINNLSDLFNLIINLLFGLGLAIGLIFVIIGGIKFVTSSGDSQKFEEAKNTVIYSIIGILVIVGFQTTINLVLYIFGSGNLASYLSQQANCTVNTNFTAAIADDPTSALSAIACSLNILIVALRHVAMALSLVFSLVAGIKYSTASGNPDKLKEAQQTLTWAIVAAVLAVFFWAILVMIANIFGMQGIEKDGIELKWTLDFNAP